MIKDSTTLAKSEDDDSNDCIDKDGVDSIVGVKVIH